MKFRVAAGPVGGARKAAGPRGGVFAAGGAGSWGAAIAEAAETAAFAVAFAAGLGASRIVVVIVEDDDAAEAPV